MNNNNIKTISTAINTINTAMNTIDQVIDSSNNKKTAKPAKTAGAEEYYDLPELPPNKIYVLINRCYGGFELSEKAYDLYNCKMRARDSNHIDVKHEWNIKRHDPVLIEVFKELKSEFEEGQKMFMGKLVKNTRIMACEIEKKYMDYYSIDDYDGMETPNINYSKYTKTELKKIFDSDENDTEKLKKIREICDEIPNLF